MSDATEPEPDVDHLETFQGRPDAPRCHWCNRTKVRQWRALVCAVCGVPPKETT
jgi:hypothetical protein